jgi:hypothetical protein
VRVGRYARVSTERPQERGTVASQLEALRAAAEAAGDEIVEEFVDDGYSGARLDRPGLDRLRDAAEAGVLDGVLCLCADRLARAYAYQVLVLEELGRFGVAVRFLEGPALGDDPQATLLVQMQGVIADTSAPRSPSATAAESSTAPAPARSSSGRCPTAIAAWCPTTAARRGSRSSSPRPRSCARSSAPTSTGASRSARSPTTYTTAASPHRPANRSGAPR